MMDRILDGVGFAGDIYNPNKMHVARATAQTLTTNAYTTILFDTVAYDSSGDGGVTAGYKASTGEYLIPVGGYFETDAIINVVMPAVVVEQIAYISLFVNGAERRRGHGERYVNAGNANTISSHFSSSDYYSAGDSLTIRCWTFSGGANPATPATVASNYWCCHRISS